MFLPGFVRSLGVVTDNMKTHRVAHLGGGSAGVESLLEEVPLCSSAVAVFVEDLHEGSRSRTQLVVVGEGGDSHHLEG